MKKVIKKKTAEHCAPSAKTYKSRFEMSGDNIVSIVEEDMKATILKIHGIVLQKK